MGKAHVLHCYNAPLKPDKFAISLHFTMEETIKEAEYQGGD